jgi:hypothetical protein
VTRITLAALATCHGACLATILRSSRYNVAAYTTCAHDQLWENRERQLMGLWIVISAALGFALSIGCIWYQWKHPEKFPDPPDAFPWM